MIQHYKQKREKSPLVTPCPPHPLKFRPEMLAVTPGGDSLKGSEEHIAGASQNTLLPGTALLCPHTAPFPVLPKVSLKPTEICWWMVSPGDKCPQLKAKNQQR